MNMFETRRLLALFVLATVAPTFAQVSRDNLIVPGERISGVALGMDLNSGVAAGIASFPTPRIPSSGGPALAQTDCTHPEDRDKDIWCTRYQWNYPENRMTSVVFWGPLGDQKVIVIATSRKDHKTHHGFGDGTSLASFVQAFGDAQTGSEVPLVSGYRLMFTGESERIFEWAWWPTRGLAVTYTKDTRVSRLVAIFTPQR